jgi:hypothetical protein
MAFEDLIARYESEPAAEPEPKSSGFADLIARYEPGAVTQREVPAPLGAWAQAQLVAANTLLPDVSAEDARELLRIAREDDLTPYETHEQIGLIKELRSIQQLQRTVEGARVLAGYLGPNYVMPLIQDRIDEMGTAEQTLRSIYEHSARGADVVATGFAGSRALFAGERATPRRGVAALEYPEALPLTASMAEQGPIMGATAVASAAPRAAGAAYGALIGALVGGPAGAAAGGRAGWQVGSVPGELAALTSGFSLEAGNLYQELSTYRDPDTRQQIDIDLARGASIAYGLVAGVLEAKGVDIVLNGVPAPIRRQVQNLNRGAIAKMMETRAGRAALSRFGRSVGDLLARAGSEGFTEVMQETMQNLVTAVVRASEGIDDPVDFTEGVAEAGVTGAEAAFGYGAIAMMIRGGRCHEPGRPATITAVHLLSTGSSRSHLRQFSSWPSIESRPALDTTHGRLTSGGLWRRCWL